MISRRAVRETLLGNRTCPVCASYVRVAGLARQDRNRWRVILGEKGFVRAHDVYLVSRTGTTVRSDQFSQILPCNFALKS
jgi:hypothetical protein